jgi:hypothetical protein
MSFEYYPYNNRYIDRNIDLNITRMSEDSTSYTEVLMEDSIMLESEHHSNKTKRKNKKRKWQEIEAIKEDNRLRKELNALDFDYDYDFSDEG